MTPIPVTGEITELAPEVLLAVCLFDEAVGEGLLGMAAVSKVIWNRRQMRYSSDGTIKGTVLAPNQFSGFWFDYVQGAYRRVAATSSGAMLQADKLLDKFQGAFTWHTVSTLAKATSVGDFGFWPQTSPAFAKLTDQAVHYYNPSVVHDRPPFADPSRHLVDIGHHSFFGPMPPHKDHP